MSAPEQLLMLFASQERCLKFKDPSIDSIAPNDLDAIYRMIVRDLCGEKYYKQELDDIDRKLLTDLLRICRTDGLNYAQFNELLLLLHQDRVTEAFFSFFAAREKSLKFDALKKAIVQFRGFAILKFGNFRFAYRKLIQAKSVDDLVRETKPYCRTPEECFEKLAKRPDIALATDLIPRDDTWANGFLSRRRHDWEAAELEKRIAAERPDPEFVTLAKEYAARQARFQHIETTAANNTEVYLTWDHMDVYIATSMRQQWEFADVFDTVKELFSDERLKKLKLRYFDPTQSAPRSRFARIEKGLVEGLMLKRARCTIYMAQEADTMGKDSELASTLAQGKAVIAYVPKINVEIQADRVSHFPLDYFKLRLGVMQAEGAFENPDLLKDLQEYDPDFRQKIEDFDNEYSEYRNVQPFSFWEAKEQEFRDCSANFKPVCKIIAIAEYHSFERRARTLKESHPLSLQVDLNSGVANGVLVVRSIPQCAEVLYAVLTNDLAFTFVVNSRENATILQEDLSGSPFRVVTNNDKLSNSFWNFYLVEEA